nr:uncharacterized protein LOC106682857 [Halyomorpha halys]
MDNACFQDDSIIEMENVRLEERNGKVAEKEKIAVTFENTTYTKIDVPETGLNQINKQPSEACQPQLCREVSKRYQKVLETNKNFDPMLKLKAILFLIICFTLFIWCLVHFIAINSPTN